MSFTNAFALVIGVGQYDQIGPLAKPANDAQSIRQVLIDSALCGYPPENVKLLVDDQATKKQIQDGLQWLATQAKSTSTVSVFFSGHGGQDPAHPLTGNYLLPHDCDPFENGTLSADKLSLTSISSDEFTEAIKAIDSQKLVVIFDCCHSGGVGDASRALSGLAKQMRAGLSEDYYADLARGKGRVIIASCLPDEKSWERANMHNGIFTTHLLAALRGRAAVREDGLIHILDVFHDLNVRVPPAAATCYDPDVDGPAQQHPLLKAETQDNFAIALDQGGAKSIQASHEQLLKTHPISQIRSLITGDPIKGTEDLIEYLSDKPVWSSEKLALGVRLTDLRKAADQEYAIGMVTPAAEANRRLAIHFALSVCWDIEDRVRSGQTV
jgi:hypothetical protein